MLNLFKSKPKPGYLRLAALGLMLMAALWWGAAPAAAQGQETKGDAGAKVGTAATTATATTAAEEYAKCPADTLPIETVGSVLMSSKYPSSKDKDASGKPIRQTFQSVITEHLAAKLGQEGLCPNSVESREHSLIQFVYMSLIEDENAMNKYIAGRSQYKNLIEPDTKHLPLSAVRPLEDGPVGGCRIRSPWLDLSVNREPVPMVRAIIRFNERQIFADQAVLAGIQDVPPGVAVPFTEDEASSMLRDYMRHAGPSISLDGEGNRLPKQPIEKIVPPDLLWFFNNTPGGDRGNTYYREPLKIEHSEKSSYLVLFQYNILYLLI